MLYSTQAVGCWLIAAIGVDRLTAVVSVSLYAVVTCTARRAIIVSTVMYVVASLYCLPYLVWVATRNGSRHYNIRGRYGKLISPALNMAMVVAPVVVIMAPVVYRNWRIAEDVLRRGRGLEFARITPRPEHHASASIFTGITG